MAELTEHWAKEAERFRKEGKFEEALECLNKTAENTIVKKTEDYWYQQGLSHCEIHDFEKALECFDKDIRIRDKNPNVHYSKAIIFFMLGRNEDAIESFNKYYELMHSNFLKYNDKAEKLRSVKKVEKALDYLNHLNQIKELPYSYWFYKGVCLQNTNNHDKAIECFDNALKVDTSDEPLVLLCKAKSEAILKNHENCLNMLEKAIEQDPHIKKLILIDETFHCLKEEEAFQKLFNFKKFLTGKTTI